MNKLIKAIEFYSQHPYEFVEDILSIKPTHQQGEVLKILPKAIEERKGVVVKSGHGIGKTALESWIILWFMATRPKPKIPCTAPTQHQLFDVLWSELAKWWKQSKVMGMFEWTRTTFYNKKHQEEWFAVARTARKPENMQGFHSDHLLFVIEEASGVDDSILEVVEGALTNEGALCIMFGNPTQLSGGFHRAFHSNRRFYYTFTFSSEDSPLVTKRYCEVLREKYGGKDSDIYRVRVLGKFPKAEPDTIISLDKVERAVQNEYEVREVDKVFEMGVDVARFGNDETVIFSRVGNRFRIEDRFKKRDLMHICGVLVRLIRENQGSYEVVVNIDDSGLGGGVTDRMREVMKDEELRCEINGVNNGSAADENEKYVNRGSEMWMWLSEHILEFDIPDDNDLIAQLSTRKYRLNSKGKIEIERKDEMKKRGLTSPDRADAMILSCNTLIGGGVEGAKYVPYIG